MDTLLARFLDGDLTEDEARTLQARLAVDKALAAELRGLEAALDNFAALRGNPDAPAFADRVMQALPPAARTAGRPGRAPWRAFALAATVLLSLGLGWVSGRQGAGPAPRQPEAAAFVAAPAAADAPLRWVRLVHVPADPAVERVAVAGDFNGWDAGATPMARRGNAWVAWLALPADVYEYMFVENDGERWVTDPLALHTRDDGFGGENAVLDLGL
ncbi:MAG: hypothetical protein R6X35_01935 [Candidatus Krumholzibacteriia bacterium]